MQMRATALPAARPFRRRTMVRPLRATLRRAASVVVIVAASAGAASACGGGLASLKDLIVEDERVFSYGQTPSMGDINRLAASSRDLDRRRATVELGRAGVSSAGALVTEAVEAIERVAEIGRAIGPAAAAAAARDPSRRSRLSATGETVGRACGDGPGGSGSAEAGEGGAAGSGAAGGKGLSDSGPGDAIHSGGSIAWSEIEAPSLSNNALVFLVLIVTYGLAHIARLGLTTLFHMIFRRKRCVIPVELRFGPYSAEGRIVILGSTGARLTFEELPGVDSDWRGEARRWEEAELVTFGRSDAVRILDISESIAVVEFQRSLSLREQQSMLMHSLARPCTIVDFGGYQIASTRRRATAPRPA